MKVKKTNKKKRVKDSRVTSPLVSWKIVAAIVLIIYFFVVGQYFLLNLYQDKITNLLGLLAYYLGFTCILITVLFALVFWYLNGKVLKEISDGARKVANGDFSVRIKSRHQDGRKNEIDLLIDDFNKMTMELEGNEMLKSDFIANVSHEIKTPLSIIQSYTKALKEQDLSEQEKEKYMDVIINTSANLSLMITNILKLNKLENERMPAKLERFQIGEQLRQCALSFMDKWQQKDIDFLIDVIDVEITSDQGLTELIFNNLLSNAVKFSQEGGTIQLTSYLDDGFLFITVKDDGCGMDEKVKARIFEKFYQGDPSHSEEGNGLGLSIVKKALDIIGGEIEVNSRLNEGSEFIVKLKVN